MKRPALTVFCAAVYLAIVVAGMAATRSQAQQTHQPRQQPDGQAISARLPVDINSDFCQGRQTWEEFSEYHVELLRLALTYSNSGIVIKPVCMDYPTEKRRIALLQAGDETNIVFFGTTPEREHQLRAVHFPIFLGTTGLRLFMTLPDVSSRLNQISSLEDLRQFSFGQGLGWPDGAILQENGLTVVDGRYLTLHAMLARGRFDLYPRAYWQIRNEYDWMHTAEPSLVINNRVALYYPQPIYFFVSPDQAQLHDAILIGLKRAWKDGAVMALLRKNRETGPSFRNIDPTSLHLIHLPKIEQTTETDDAMQKYGLVDGSNFTTKPAPASRKNQPPS
ncbi:hypothetical protein [Thalassospira mesophila]|nr:hypothetical protein [Thalassospira mesophila]